MTWSDEKMDVLASDVDALDTKIEAGFAGLDKRFDLEAVRTAERFKQVDLHFERIDERFERIDERFDEAERRSRERAVEIDRRFTEMYRGFTEIDRRLGKAEAGDKERAEDLNHRFDRLEDRFDAFHRSFMQICGGLIGTLIVALVTVITTH